jgi:hypothetical protein
VVIPAVDSQGNFRRAGGVTPSRRNVMLEELRSLGLQEIYGLIGSDRIEGTRVFNSKGERIGRIERLMIDRLTGQVAYAVMRFGGFLGMGEERFPVPWPLLSYNPDLGGYEAALPDDLLKAAPELNPVMDEDRAEVDQLYRYYNTPPYWA